MSYEDVEAWALGAAGAIQGIYKYCIKPELTPERGWAAIGAFVLAFDMLADKTLSEGVDSALESHKWATRAVIGYTAMHLLNLIPENYDIYHQATLLARKKS